MFAFSKTIKLILLLLNVACVVAMAVCAYSSCLPPQQHPRWSVLGHLFPLFLFVCIAFIILWLFLKWKFAAVSVAGLLLCFGAARDYCPVNIPRDCPEDVIKIMTYNVRAFGFQDGHTWKDNPVLTKILESDADIVCLQEIGGFGAATNMGRVKQGKYPYTVMDNGIACLSKYPILSKKRIRFKSVGNSSFAYELRVGEDTLLLINNHLESYKLSAADKELYEGVLTNPKSAEDNKGLKDLILRVMAANRVRGSQVDTVAAFLESNISKYRHVILCGDLNEPPISYSHYRFSEILDDAFASAGNGLGFTYKRNGMYFRLDHVMVSEDIEVYDAYVDYSEDASDHYPIVCTLGLNP